MYLNLFPIFEIIILSFISMLILERVGKKFKLFDYPKKNKIHDTKVTKIAGLGFIFLIINSFVLFDYSIQLNYSLNILILFVLVGFYDDVKGLGASSKILFMIVPTFLYVYENGLVTTLGEYKYFNLELKSLSFIFSLCCILLLTNAYNYIDGMDGLLGTLSIGSLTYFLLILPTSEFSFISPFLIFLTVYLFFNLKIFNILPKLFIGDSGSIGIGFLFCIIVIHYTQNLNFIHESTAIWGIAFVVYEFLTINILRIKKNKNPFNRDLNFIFNKFLEKYSKTKTLIYCNLINLLFCLLGYILHFKKQYEVSIFLFIVLYFVYLYFRIQQDKN